MGRRFQQNNIEKAADCRHERDVFEYRRCVGLHKMSELTQNTWNIADRFEKQ